MDHVVAFRIRGLNLPQELRVDRVAFLFQHIERESDVVGGYFRTVEETRLWA